jgi:hypothetical protein
MTANALLHWMSARRKGSWQQFRAAVEELHVQDEDVATHEDDEAPDQFELPLYQALRLNLQRVGHAEFFAGADDAEWRVTPPSLALTRSVHGWLGVLVGARSRRLQQRVISASASQTLQTMQIPGCPDQILVFAGNEDALAAIAQRADLVVQREAPAALLTCLPPIDDPAVRHACPLPFGAEWKIERFCAADLRWKPTTSEHPASASGELLRYSLRYRREVLFCLRGKVFRVPGQVGKFLILNRRRRRVLRYDSGSLRLSVPANCRPPFLVERALILCSGSLPSYRAGSGSGTLEYDQIPESIARTTAALLRQDPR